MTCVSGGEPSEAPEAKTASYQIAESVRPTNTGFRRLDGVEVADYDSDPDDEVSDPLTPLLAPVESKRRRVASPDDFLEKEEDVPEADLEDFVSRMEDLGITRESASWQTLWREHAETRLRVNDPPAYAEYLQQMYGAPPPVQEETPDPEAVVEPNVEEAEPNVEDAGGDPEDDRLDDDGAVVMGGDEPPRVRLPPGVPTPSQEMVRRHRASGHVRFAPWCADCVRGAANAPSHHRRAEDPLLGVPELHSDYGFFRDKKGDKVNTVTVLVTRDRKSTGICANVVPKKGVGGGYAVKQYLRDIKKFGYHHKILIRSDGEPALCDLLS